MRFRPCHDYSIWCRSVETADRRQSKKALGSKINLNGNAAWISLTRQIEFPFAGLRSSHKKSIRKLVRHRRCVFVAMQRTWELSGVRCGAEAFAVGIGFRAGVVSGQRASDFVIRAWVIYFFASSRKSALGGSFQFQSIGAQARTNDCTARFGSVSEAVPRYNNCRYGSNRFPRTSAEWSMRGVESRATKEQRVVTGGQRVNGTDGNLAAPCELRRFNLPAHQIGEQNECGGESRVASGCCWGLWRWHGSRWSPGIGRVSLLILGMVPRGDARGAFAVR